MAFVDTNSPLPAMALGFPDVCNTPMGPAVVPVPYPNVALKIMAIPSQGTFLVMGMPGHNMTTMIPLTQGDSPGVLLGLMSGTEMAPGKYAAGSTVLIISGVPATMLGAPTMQNGTNAIGVEIAPTQVVLATV